MLKALFWRINFFLKNRKSAKINRQLGNGVKSVIVDSKNGLLAVDPRDLEVGYKLRNYGSYGLDELTRINKLITNKSNVLVVVGICTHLGCSPSPKLAAKGDMGSEWEGGFFCPCHGSKFDLSGRVFKGSAAPTNLVVPPHKYVDNDTIIIGEDQEEKV